MLLHLNVFYDLINSITNCVAGLCDDICVINDDQFMSSVQHQSEHPRRRSSALATLHWIRATCTQVQHKQGYCRCHAFHWHFVWTSFVAFACTGNVLTFKLYTGTYNASMIIFFLTDFYTIPLQNCLSRFVLHVRWLACVFDLIAVHEI